MVKKGLSGMIAGRTAWGSTISRGSDAVDDDLVLEDLLHNEIHNFNCWTTLKPKGFNGVGMETIWQYITFWTG